MNVHVLQHVPFEGLGALEPWFLNHGATLSTTHLYADEALPGYRDLDWLVIMGGPMSANDEDAFPWLVREKAFVCEVIQSGRTVLGVCLGAQLIAAAQGARVFPNWHREIGWFPIEQTESSMGHPLAEPFATPLEVLHWHGETFENPEGSVHLAKSEGCENQAFAIGPRVLGLQFHLETSRTEAKSLIENCADALLPGRYVQTAAQILSDDERFVRIQAVMSDLLGQMLESATAG